MISRCGLKWLAIALSTVLVVSCAQPKRSPQYYPWMNSKHTNAEMADVTSGIKQRTLVTDRKTRKLAEELKKDGVDVLTVGQDYRIIVPIQKLFFNTSPKVMPGAYGTLNRIVEYLKQYRKVSVRVSAFSNDYDSARAGALSLARARSVADYIWSQDVDARLVYTQAHSVESGLDCCKQEVDRSREDSRSHLEIIFRNRIL